jgi:deazaflavin-dependent oxidoreductase (nitroreductase family)
MSRRHRRKGYKFMGMDVLFLTTIGRRPGQRRETPVAWFSDGDDASVIVASAAGGAHNPEWYYNLAASPDQVWIETSGDRALHVRPEQLDGARRAEVWNRIASQQPRYAEYQENTHRLLPAIRMTPTTERPR